MNKKVSSNNALYHVIGNDLLNWGVVALPLVLTWFLVRPRLFSNSRPSPTISLVLFGLLAAWLVWRVSQWLPLLRATKLPWYIVLNLAEDSQNSWLKQSGLREIPNALGPTQNLDPLLAAKTVALEDTGVYVVLGMEEMKRDVWLEAPKRLKKFLRGAPLSGVLIATPIDERSETQLTSQQAQRIRERLQDLTDLFGVNPPVYLIGTKSEQLGGFLPFFAHLSTEEREQAWGATLTGLQQADPSRAFATTSQTLYQALDARRLGRLAAVAPAERQGVYQFPIAFTKVCNHLQQFVDTIFCVPAAYEGFIFRGFYFTSNPGTETLYAQPSYFIKNLLSIILWRDQGLTRPTHKADRQHWFRRMALSGGAGVLAVVLLVGLPKLNAPEPEITPTPPAATEIVATATEATLVSTATVSSTLTPTSNVASITETPNVTVTVTSTSTNETIGPPIAAPTTLEGNQ